MQLARPSHLVADVKQAYELNHAYPILSKEMKKEEHRAKPSAQLCLYAGIMYTDSCITPFTKFTRTCPVRTDLVPIRRQLLRHRDAPAQTQQGVYAVLRPSPSRLLNYLHR
jgi:hypothetical protein